MNWARAGILARAIDFTAGGALALYPAEAGRVGAGHAAGSSCRTYYLGLAIARGTVDGALPIIAA